MIERSAAVAGIEWRADENGLEVGRFRTLAQKNRLSSKSGKIKMPRLSIPSLTVRHSCLTVLMLMLAFVLVAAGQEPANADAVLRRTRERLLAELARMPRYTCL